MRNIYLISGLFCLFVHALQAQGTREEFLAEASYDNSKRELVIKVTADESDISIVQLSISRPYADEASIKETKNFVLFVVQHDESDSKAASALIDQANTKVRLYRGSCSITAKETKEIRFPAKRPPDQKCHIIVGAELLRAGRKIGVYLDAKLK